MIDARTHCPCCHAPRTVTKRTDAPLLDILADIDRAHDLAAWHRDMQATRPARQAERARQSRAAARGHSTRLRKQFERDPLISAVANPTKRLCINPMQKRRRRLRERDGDNCYYCGDVMDFDNTPLNERFYASVEHLHPLSLGGTNDMSNLVLAHSKCNKAQAALTYPTVFKVRRALTRTSRTAVMSHPAAPPTLSGSDGAGFYSGGV